MAKIKNNYIKSPLNYTGGKHKLLPQLSEYIFNKGFETFIDVFGGGFNVGINSESNKIVYNEKCPNVYSIINGIMNEDRNIENFKSIINKYNLNKENEEGFYKIRDDYNSGNKDWRTLYMIICHSFNNQIRFNKKGEYNMPFGKNRSSFNDSLKKKYVIFEEALKSKNIKLLNLDFRHILDNEYIIENNTLFYCDPPYLISTATYNENGGWTEKDELDLLNSLDNVDKLGGKFALSNIIKHKGKENTLLIEWSKKYKINFLDKNYNNCNYQSKNEDKETIEVLITNY